MRLFKTNPLLLVFAVLSVSSCTKDPVAPVTTPGLELLDFTELKRTSVILKADPSSATHITECGFLVGKSYDLNDARRYPIADYADGEMSLELTGLEIGATYYYQAYLADGEQTLTTATNSFTTATQSAPLISDFKLIGNTLSAVISDNGGRPISHVGFCWSTKENPDIYSYSAEVELSGVSFSMTVPQVEVGVDYYFRAFADNGTDGISTITYSENAVTYQRGYLSLNEHAWVFDSSGGSFELIVQSNVDYTVSEPDVSWIMEAYDPSSRLFNTYHYDVHPFISEQDLVGHIYVSAPSINQIDTVTVKLLRETVEPFYIEAIDSGVITISNPDGHMIEYQLDTGSWYESNSQNVEIAITSGQKLGIRGNQGGIKHISGSVDYYAYGNLLSLFDKYEPSSKTLPNGAFRDLFEGEVNLHNHPTKDLLLPVDTIGGYACSGMFSGCSNLQRAPDLTASTVGPWGYASMFAGCTNLKEAPKLPAMELGEYCYYNMFSNCQSLNSTVELPALTLSRACYEYMFQFCTGIVEVKRILAETLANHCCALMFYNCSRITQAPELPATNLADACYKSMFSECTGLLYAPSTLPATVLAEECYNGMFINCVKLLTAPTLPALTARRRCYAAMFASCSSLLKAPDLPATVLDEACYESMFQLCTSMTDAPSVLPATELATECYHGMFDRSGIVKAPALPALTLAPRCYRYMLSSCDNLEYIKIMAVDISAEKALENFTNTSGVRGTFVMNAAAAWDPTGIAPYGWTIMYAHE